MRIVILIIQVIVIPVIMIFIIMILTIMKQLAESYVELLQVEACK